MDSETAAELDGTVEPYEANPGPVLVPPPGPTGAADGNKTVKTGYIVLKVDRSTVALPGPDTVLGDWPPLVVLNEADSEGQPVPVEAYNRPQAVKTLLTQKGIAEDSAEGVGDFVAIPIRSFQIMSRRLESSITESVEDGSL